MNTFYKYMVLVGGVALAASPALSLKAYAAEKIIPRITVEASASVEIAPDIAEISFTVREEAATAAAATAVLTKKSNAALTVLQVAGIAKKDIKLTSNGFYPQYDYIQCVTTPCESQKLRGYQGYRTFMIKVRNLDKAPEVVQLLGTLSITEMNGPEFKIENEAKVRSQARREAVRTARTKAREIASDLGVRLVRIISFTEQNDYAYPMMYTKAASVADASMPEMPVLPEGKNSYTSRVTVEYEIR